MSWGQPGQGLISFVILLVSEILSGLSRCRVTSQIVAGTLFLSNSLNLFHPAYVLTPRITLIIDAK